jgi:hypothetical protein
MRHRILLLVVGSAVFGSCTTMYKSGQTPDDVYYSPGREVPAYVQTEEKSEESPMYNENENMSDYYLRMKAYDRNRWSAFDNDPMYWNDWRWNNQLYFNTFRPGVSMGIGHGTGWNTGMNYHTGYTWGSPYNGGYSPFTAGYYGAPIIVINPKTYNPKAYTPRNGNLGSNYTNNRNYSTDPKTGARTYNISTPSSSPTRQFGNSRGSSSRGYTTDSYYNNNSSNRSESGNSSPSRSLDRSSGGSTNSSSGSRSSGSSSSSGSAGSAPVRTFTKGGGQ